LNAWCQSPFFTVLFVKPALTGVGFFLLQKINFLFFSQKTKAKQIPVQYIGCINIRITLAWGNEVVSKSHEKWYIYFGDKA